MYSTAISIPSRIPESKFLLMNNRLETDLVSNLNVELTHLAAFELLYTRDGRQHLKSYHDHYLKVSEYNSLTYIMETPTWRANPDWIFRLGYSHDEVTAINRHAVQFLREIQYAKSNASILIGGCVGPRRDEGKLHSIMSPDEATDYHSTQISVLALEDVDLISGSMMTNTNETVGVVNAARLVGVPVIITVDLDSEGKLSDGSTLAEAIAKVDKLTSNYTTHFMVNCSFDSSRLLPQEI